MFLIFETQIDILQGCSYISFEAISMYRSINTNIINYSSLIFFLIFKPRKNINFNFFRVSNKNSRILLIRNLFCSHLKGKRENGINVLVKYEFFRDDIARKNKKRV